MSFDCVAAVNAVSVSPDSKLAVVGGREVLKVLRLAADELSEQRNLRPGGRRNLNHSTNDVRWNPCESHKSLIATAATNCNVGLWDLERGSGTKGVLSVLKGHRRTPNRVCWNSFNATCLLSCSQDGTVRRWDTRTQACAETFSGVGPVRDVQFDPFHATVFAAAYENGTVQLWDTRQPTHALTRFSAHNALVLALQWHPQQQNKLATGGRDKHLKVWRVTPSGVESESSIATIASVGRVAWRPGFDNQIATAAQVLHNRVQLWDTRRPFAPVASFGGCKDVITGMQWLDSVPETAAAAVAAAAAVVANGDQSSATTPRVEDRSSFLLMSSKDKTVALQSVDAAERAHARVCTSAITLTPTHLAWLHDPIDREALWEKRKTSAESQGSATSSVPSTSSVAPVLPPPDAVLHTRTTLRPASRPASQPTLQPQLRLRDASVTLGSLLMDPPVPVFTYLAQHYKFDKASRQALCRHNARVAHAVGCYELRQVWLILGVLCQAPSKAAVAPTSAPDVPTVHPPLSPGSTSSRADAPTGATAAPAAVQQFPSASSARDVAVQLGSVFPAGGDGFREGDVEGAWLSSDEDADDGIRSFADTDTVSSDGDSLSSDEELGGGGGGGAGGRAGSGSGGGGVGHSSTGMPSSRRTFRDETTSVTFSRTDSVMGTPAGSVVAPAAGTEGSGAAAGAGVGAGASGGVDGSAAGDDMADGEGESLKDTTIRDLLRHYGDKGDVQTCVTVCSVVGPDVERLADNKVMKQWIISYVDLLHRLQLWTPASTIMARSWFEDVRQITKASTSIAAKCKCGAPLDASDPLHPRSPEDMARCASCRKALLRQCGVCEQRVKGLYVWCQGCDHGGHLTHMQQWFASNTHCPTGCNHVCDLGRRVLRPVAIPNTSME